MTYTAKGFGNEQVDEREWALIHHLGQQGRSGLAITASAGNRTVQFATGFLAVCGVLFEVTVAETLAAAANTSGSTRYDLVIARLDWSNNSGTITLKQGTPGALQPTVTQTPGIFWEEPLARLTVANGQGAFAAGDVLSLVSASRPTSASSGTNINISNTGFGFGSTTVGCQFVAPHSGEVRVSIHAAITKTTTNTVEISYSIRIGHLTTGTAVVTPNEEDRSILQTGGTSSDRLAVSAGPFFHTGLTPGTLYTAWMEHLTGGGTQTLLSRQITVEPVATGA